MITIKIYRGHFQYILYTDKLIYLQNFLSKRNIFSVIFLIFPEVFRDTSEVLIL